MNGIIIIDKPKHETSFWVVDRIRKLTGEKKVGHTGTLDPLATGVLPICLGEATKASDLFMSGDKVYEVTAKLGERTDTLDAAGKVVEKKDISHGTIDKRTILETIKKFIGDIEQTPPMYSALKKKGRPLYEWARKGVEVDRETRTVNIKSIELLSYEFPLFSLEVHCSKGTYIRTLVDDIGSALGVFAHVVELRRTRSGAFDIKEACSLDGELKLLSLEKAISMMIPLHDIDKDLAIKIARGYKIDLEQGLFAVQSSGKLVAIVKDKKIERVFNYAEWS